jgi:hypothetical protein
VVAVTTCAPFFNVLHKPWFQAKEGHELDQFIGMFIFECSEELQLCNVVDLKIELHVST